MASLTLACWVCGEVLHATVTNSIADGSLVLSVAPESIDHLRSHAPVQDAGSWVTACEPCGVVINERPETHLQLHPDEVFPIDMDESAEFAVIRSAKP